MRKRIAGCLVVLSLGALVAGGCAKKDLVKEEPPPPVTAPAPEAAKPAQEARPEAPKAPVTEQTPVREPVVAQEPARETPKASGDLQGLLQKIYFNFDSSDLSEDSRNLLTRNAEYLSKQPSVKIRIEGNCDERGSDDYNMALGERRAKAAKDYLVNLGISSERISTISYGEEKPVDAGHDEAAWAKNRRDEFVVVK
ncbi:peptidoglycan-associated lipoprotein Pal [Geomonas sp. Red69]|uniref:Peptidoglycan-associated lipoprotein n=1 Tax=Geomonas diazotrophica TaxID=2843197 RepID=A0ABX8JEP0_9BACT|nr:MULTISPECIES: peptidoglycan-associated lipoprotein Pal [Geomonas]MBU5635956.1 peptidoglycan-associated lipoprotein Pal [Geomonas diazotrophica]QWV96865.1 peptidoglycan-associated lipoprotein Pal [Geomonas nitrogeniifigens]QXE86030.1 peptidoglycan-associated lipoprotein Pal [Geomonas nitrogeniifigens]